MLASQPSLWLWPNTSQNGFPSVVTVTELEVLPASTVLTVAPAVSSGAPRGATAVAAPPAAEESTTRSTSMPTSRPVAVVTVWLPASRSTATVARFQRQAGAGVGDVTGDPHGEPWPSTRTRSSRQTPASAVGDAGALTPGIETSENETGRVSGPMAAPPSGSTARYSSTTRRSERAVTGAKSSGTWVAVSGEVEGGDVRAVGFEVHLGGDRVLAVGDHVEVDVAHGDGRAEIDAHPPALLRPDGCRPRARGVAVERARRARLEHRRADDPTR